MKAILTDSFLPGVGETEKAVFGLSNEFCKKIEELLKIGQLKSR